MLFEIRLLEVNREGYMTSRAVDHGTCIKRPNIVFDTAPTEVMTAP
jgi:hypothetical protein